MASQEECSQEIRQGQAGRFGATVSWCQEIVDVLAALSGVTVVTLGEDSMLVRLLTSFHTTWEPTGAQHHLQHVWCLALVIWLLPV